ncbi:MAG: hypothetical protein LUE29_04665 [Lachnospiraceae bacterium]|nr:hypothetical protein [Lachnospiraceae bacterium]
MRILGGDDESAKRGVIGFYTWWCPRSGHGSLLKMLAAGPWVNGQVGLESFIFNCMFEYLPALLRFL